MQQQQEKTDRKVIPRWRSLSETPPPELIAAKKIVAAKLGLSIPEDVLAGWRNAPTIETAAELLAVTPLIGVNPHVQPAAQFLRTHIETLSPGVRRLVEWYEARGDIGASEHRALIAEDDARTGIRSLKREIGNFPRNPIAHVELARHHSVLGQSHSARRAMDRAVILAPQNRFVLRAAARMLVSQGKFDEALAVLRNGAVDDPWLAATRIGVSELAHQSPANVRAALQLIEDRPPNQTTELAAALGTLELSASLDMKRARRLFRRSAEAPNDNAVAQIRWANEKRGIPFEVGLLQTERSYEARTGQAVRHKDWQLAVKNACFWLADEPFARLPAVDGCFWAAELRRDFQSAETLATVGLTAHPSDVALLNNRAYVRANRGNLIGAKADLEAARTRHPSPGDEIVLAATEGCIRYRSEEYSRGAEAYETAIRHALHAKHHDVAQRALLHWLHEEQRVGRIWEPELLLKINLYFSDKALVSETVRDIFAAHFAGMSVVRGMPTPENVQNGVDIVFVATSRRG